MTKEEFIRNAPFGYCPICGAPFAWDSDGTMADRTGNEKDDDVPVIFLSCHHCGASAEIIGCSHEEMPQYPFWDGKDETDTEEQRQTEEVRIAQNNAKAKEFESQNMKGSVWDEEPNEEEEIDVEARRWGCIGTLLLYLISVGAFVYGICQFFKNYIL